MTSEKTKISLESNPMIGGDGPCSYAQNSCYQKAVVDAAKGMINEGIKDKLDFKNPCYETANTFRIADFGCSTGPNTFFAMENIIEAVENKYQLENPSTLEFQVFFNDLTKNDFNALFQTLSSYQKYFAAGVPGSFYGRLFPKSTLHFVHSSYALHWLSTVPKEIVDSKSPACNKGSIQCTGFSKEVAKAYAAQFMNDIDTFLNARAEELVAGGLMVVLIAGLPDGVLMSQTATGILFDLLGFCLMDMAKLGLISEEKVDSFNLPIYFSSTKELEEIIKSNGRFSIERMDTWNHPMLQTKPGPEYVVLQLRAVFEGLLKMHFGDENVVDKIFKYYTKKLSDSSFIFEGVIHQSIELFVLLKRNIN